MSRAIHVAARRSAEAEVEAETRRKWRRSVNASL